LLEVILLTLFNLLDLLDKRSWHDHHQPRVELDVNYRHIAQSGLRFDIGGNITFIKNEVNNSPYTVIIRLGHYQA
jgi:hypothetical protein